MRFFILIALLLLIPFISFSQNILIQGKITDSQSNVSLIGATVFVTETKTGTTADENGNYSISLSPGIYIFRISYVGYETLEKEVNTQSSRWDFQLKSDMRLKEIIVSGRRKEENLLSLTMGVERLNIQEIKTMPALMGEVDILKAIQLLPGVQTASEGGSGFSVRGGSPDQNLITLDNTTVYNPSHLMGFFSIFNNDVISGIELYKGDIPFRFGGRLSSLLEVNTKSEIPSRFGGTGGIGLISSRLMLEGPIGRKTSYMIGGRRSYADLFLKLSSDENTRSAHIYFYDTNLKLSHRLSDSDKLDFNFYYGLDDFGAQPGAFKYGNLASSLIWNRVFSEDLFGKFSLNFSDYNYSLESKLDGAQTKWISRITDWALRADFHHFLSKSSELDYGLASIFHDFQPGKVLISNLPEYSVPGSKALEHSAYLSNKQTLSEKWSLKYGARLTLFQNIDPVHHNYFVVEPGISAVFRLKETSSLKASYNHNTQFMQLANNSASGSPLDVWFTVGPNIKPQKVIMYSVGYFRNFNDNMFETSVELYHKDLKNVIDFAEHAQLILNENLESEVRTGKGKAYGIELMAKKNSGRLTGFVNYTLSRSERTIAEINDGKTYLAPYDKTHSFNILASYEINKKVNVSATWVFASGTPTTYPTGRFGIGEEYFPVYSGRNEYRKPSYHRLDLSLNYVPNPNSKKFWKSEWNFSLYNAYNKKNPWIIYYDQDDISGTPYAEMLYLFGVIPSITYNFKF